uniref:Uncharacterized protein n=1 Tax=Magallana gigas TaxID=29159 RepID=A0A8W8ML50_MAGGI
MISHPSKLLEKRGNTIFSNEFVKKNPVLFQAHLERILDFMLAGKDVWWSWVEGGIEFYDGEDEPCRKQEGPRINNFTSFNLHRETSFLASVWKTYVDKFAEGLPKLPIKRIRMKNDAGKCFQHYQDNAVETHPNNDNKGNGAEACPHDAQEDTTDPCANMVTEQDPFCRQGEDSESLNQKRSLVEFDPQPKSCKKRLFIEAKDQPKSTADILNALLGNSKLVAEYTKYKRLCKTSPHDKSFRKCYDAALAKVQIAISKFQRETKNNPLLEEKRKLAESLLTHWKIYHF